jgi:hypothetical protein
MNPDDLVPQHETLIRGCRTRRTHCRCMYTQCSSIGAGVCPYLGSPLSWLGHSTQVQAAGGGAGWPGTPCRGHWPGQLHRGAASITNMGNIKWAMFVLSLCLLRQHTHGPMCSGHCCSHILARSWSSMHTQSKDQVPGAGAHCQDLAPFSRPLTASLTGSLESISDVGEQTGGAACQHAAPPYSNTAKATLCRLGAWASTRMLDTTAPFFPVPMNAACILACLLCVGLLEGLGFWS